MRNFSDLTEREVLALAIANEEEDGRIYDDIAEGPRQDCRASANLFSAMAAEESEHRRRIGDDSFFETTDAPLIHPGIVRWLDRPGRLAREGRYFRLR